MRGPRPGPGARRHRAYEFREAARRGGGGGPGQAGAAGKVRQPPPAQSSPAQRYQLISSESSRVTRPTPPPPLRPPPPHATKQPTRAGTYWRCGPGLGQSEPSQRRGVIGDLTRGSGPAAGRSTSSPAPHGTPGDPDAPRRSHRRPADEGRTLFTTVAGFRAPQQDDRGPRLRPGVRGAAGAAPGGRRPRGGARRRAASPGAPPRPCVAGPGLPPGDAGALRQAAAQQRRQCRRTPPRRRGVPAARPVRRPRPPERSWPRRRLRRPHRARPAPRQGCRGRVARLRRRGRHAGGRLRGGGRRRRRGRDECHLHRAEEEAVPARREVLREPVPHRVVARRGLRVET